jgi:Ser/Thr protein kinase RdoA (MazF antagonist)
MKRRRALGEPDVRTDEVASRLASAFGLGTARSMSRRARGALGAVWELTTDTPHGGRRTAVKELFGEEPTPEAAEAEVAFSAECRAAGVRGAAPLRTIAGDLLVGLDGVTWRAYEWVTGHQADWEDGPTLLWMAGEAAVLHRVGRPEPVDASARWYARVDQPWDELAGRYAAAGHPHSHRLLERLSDLVATTAFVNAVGSEPAIRCHRDLNATNVLVDGTRRVLVDWDNAGPLDPVRDLASVFMHVLDDHELLPRIHDAYVQAGGPARVTGPEQLVAGAAVYLNFLASQLEALLEGVADDGADHVGFAERAVGAVVESVPTVAELEAAARAIVRG